MCSNYGMIISTQQQIQKKTKRKEDNRLFLFSLLIVMTAEDEKIVVLLHKICSRGNSAEVKGIRNQKKYRLHVTGYMERANRGWSINGWSFYFLPPH